MLEEYELHKNEFVLVHFQVLKFEGVEADEHDNYYRFVEWGGRVISESSVATKPLYLKNLLAEEDYQSLEDAWKMNQKFWKKKPSQVFMNIYGDYIEVNPNSGEIEKINKF